MKTKILIVDDDISILTVLETLLEDKGIEITTAQDGKSALKYLLSGEYSIALLDINVPKMDGLTVLKEAVAAGIETSIVIMTAESTMTNTLEAMKSGAYDYVSKPFDLEEIEILIERALTNLKMKRELSSLKERVKEEQTKETAFIGRSRRIQSIFKDVGRVAPQDVTVLITGESGTGKELLARLIHSNSRRSEGPFIAVNTAAVPANLMESELFGHEKGAFTGAEGRAKGKFELASGGTLFLDEIGDTTLDLQARLLRALQESEFYRVGGREPVRVDVRIVAATNQDLEKAVEEKRFREDLYYRLNVVKMALPPLRERKGDIILLSEFFLEKFADEMGLEKTLSKSARKDMEAYHWPGNIRELENLLRRAVLLSSGVMLGPAELMLPKRRGDKGLSLSDIITERLTEFVEKTPSTGKQELYDTIMPLMERPLISLVLKKTNGNQVHAAELLGINRNTLRKKVKELKIDLSELKNGGLS